MSTTTAKKTSKNDTTTSNEEPNTTTSNEEPTTTTTSNEEPTTTTSNEEPTKTNSPLDQVAIDFKDLLDNLSTTVQTLKTLTFNAKRLEKQVNKVLKDSQKKNKKKKDISGVDKPKRAPSGFAKPSNISEELCNFLGRPLGTQMARTEVTKLVTQYIKDNELQNPVNKRHILPDQKLGTLLGADKSDEVTYFNLQKYMKHHFPKPVPTVTA